MLCLLLSCILLLQGAQATLSTDRQYLNGLTEIINSLTQRPDFNSTWKQHLERFGVGEAPTPSMVDHCPVRPRGTPPTSVHRLRPEDVDVIGAWGDSITAGNGIAGENILEVLLQMRGMSWSVGGDKSTTEGVSTLPNILKHFNSKIRGFSTGDGWAFEENAGLNQAVPSTRSTIKGELLEQVTEMVNLMKNDKDIDIEKDWKVFTLLIGGNDMCHYCEDRVLRSPTNFRKGVEESLDYLHANSPRTLINVVPLMDMTSLRDLDEGIICNVLQNLLCECLTNDETAPEFKPLQHAYASALEQLVNSGKYDTKEDFTVVIQPFLWEAQAPAGEDGKIDATFFSPDCFHPSRKAHGQLAQGLYMNMLEPVGGKDNGKSPEPPGSKLPCPSAERPYLFTNKNSGNMQSAKPKSGLNMKNYLQVKPNWLEDEKQEEIPTDVAEAKAVRKEDGIYLKNYLQTKPNWLTEEKPEEKVIDHLESKTVFTNGGFMLKNYLQAKPDWLKEEKNGRDLQRDDIEQDPLPHNRVVFGKKSAKEDTASSSASPPLYGAVIAIVSLMILSVITAGFTILKIRSRAKKSEQQVATAGQQSLSFDNPNYEPSA